ncbi:FAD-dependent oxidoreductase [Ramlibacter sp. XY19]|uniref:FAD-dependent oxidoreductase n=1 Tax=Ramlibacter paludis TaxID=2908000 RepID=UPI0023DA79B6|nr:FAD-dependent oxidoreductase [Ramlibacter paludis]MCG2591555.1 FAD-dependent oxidoreductase [Ramlibacter paludis]
MKIGIAGAGLLGRLLAFELRARGHAVHVFDPAAHAEARGAAGWTAAGMLSPVAELECADAGVFALGLRTLELWPQVLARLPAPVEFRFEGSLLVAHRGDEGSARRVLDLLASKAPAGHEPRALAAAELRELEPSVQGPSHAWLLPHEGQIHTVQAMQALAAGAVGAEWHWGTSVSRTAPGLLVTGEGEHRFDHVFDLRGTGARPELPVRGVRGEIFWLQAPGLALHRPIRLLHPRHRVYIVPRAPDLVVVGASEIESEDRSPVSLRSTVELLAAAHSVLPELAEARIVHSESNLRPALPDNLPLLQQQDGLTRINGLFRHGWLIAPALVERALQDLT